MMAIGRRATPIIDSHIHLFPESEINSISWIASDNPLAKQWSIDQYRDATKKSSSHLGFVVVETDRKFDLESGQSDGLGWRGPLQEVSWYRRVALGDPRPGEGHRPEDSKMCLAVIPWAPIPSGPGVLERYFDSVRQASGPAWSKIRGFRYLLQDKPCGTGVKKEFIDGLKLLGRHRLLFEVCIDFHRRGQGQLDDAISLVEQSRDGVPECDQVTIVLDHFLKPDLTNLALESKCHFQAWSSTIEILGKLPKVYIKLSGAFTETSETIRGQDATSIARLFQPYFIKILQSFGSDRIMFGSDWPVCTIGMDDSWSHWKQVVENMCLAAGLKESEVTSIFSGTASEVYGL